MRICLAFSILNLADSINLHFLNTVLVFSIRKSARINDLANLKSWRFNSTNFHIIIESGRIRKSSCFFNENFAMLESAILNMLSYWKSKSIENSSIGQILRVFHFQCSNRLLNLADFKNLSKIIESGRFNIESGRFNKLAFTMQHIYIANRLLWFLWTESIYK